MIREINKNSIGGIGGENATGGPWICFGDCRCITCKDSQEIICIHVFSDVVFGHAGVIVRAMWVVDDGTWSWIFRVVCNVIIDHDDDFVVRDAASM